MKIELPDFPSDCSRANPALHMLYVKTAVKHLSMVDEMIRKIGGCSNLNSDEFAYALQAVRAKKVQENTAYRDADEILTTARTRKDIEPQLAGEVEEPAA